MVADSPPGPLTDRWMTIGGDQRAELAAVELWRVDLPFLSPVLTARGPVDRRPLVLVHLLGAAGGSEAEGWGECAALADTSFDTEDVEGSWMALENQLVPALLGTVENGGGALPRPSRLERVRATAPEAPLAFAALEMAVADLHLRTAGRSLAGVLGVEGRSVEVGAVAGQASSPAALVERVASLAAEGFARVKLKIGPGWDVDPLNAVTEAVPDLRLQVDANEAYRPADMDHLVELDQFGLLCFEQPFSRGDLASHVELATRIRTPVCLDEGVDSPDAIRRALALGACSAVCVKPSRLGGIGRALEVIDRCRTERVPLWMGGMFESGYARMVTTTLAALDGFTWPGDLSPARSYLEDDVIEARPLTRSGGAGYLTARPQTGPGMGPPPDPDALHRMGARVTAIHSRAA